MIINTYDKQKKLKIHAGDLNNGVFTKQVKQQYHYCWKHKGYGISADVVKKLMTKCHTIQLNITDANRKITIDFKDLLNNSVIDNLGAGYQYFCSETYFAKIKDEVNVGMTGVLAGMPEDMKEKLKIKLGIK